MKIKLPRFYLRRGVWGDFGWYRVPWYQWLVKAEHHVNKIVWE